MVERKLFGFAGIGNGLVFHHCLLLQHLERRNLILDLLKRGEHRLPIVRHRLIVAGARLLGLGHARAAVENQLRQRGTERPHRIGRSKKRAQTGRRKTIRAGQRKIGIPGGDRHADLRVRRRHGVFGRCDIGAAFQQRGGHRHRHHRNDGRQRRGLNRDLARRLADESRDGMFHQRARQLQIDQLGLRVVDLGLRGINVGLRRDPDLEAVVGDLQRLLEILDDVHQQLRLLVDGAQLEIIHRQLRLREQTRGRDIGGAGLGARHAALHGAANAAPDIDVPAAAEGRRSH